MASAQLPIRIMASATSFRLLRLSMADLLHLAVGIGLGKSLFHQYPFCLVDQFAGIDRLAQFGDLLAQRMHLDELMDRQIDGGIHLLVAERFDHIAHHPGEAGALNRLRIGGAGHQHDRRRKLFLHLFGGADAVELRQADIHHDQQRFEFERQGNGIRPLSASTIWSNP